MLGFLLLRAGFSLVTANEGYSPVVVRWLVLFQGTGSRHMGFSSCRTQAQSTRSVAAVHGLSCSAACGIFPDQGSNLCPLRWQADFYSLYYQGSPTCLVFKDLVKLFPEQLYHFIFLPTVFISLSVLVISLSGVTIK